MINKLRWFACALVVGCSSFDSTEAANAANGGGGSDAGADALASVSGESGPSLRIGVDPTSATVTQGSTVDVTVSVVRGGGLAGPVAFAVTGANPGTTVTAVSAQDGDSSVKLTIQAAADAQQGKVSLTITGTNDVTKIFAETKVDLLVRGASGSLDTTFGSNGVLDLPGNYVSAMMADANGKLVVVGYSGSPSAGFVMQLDEKGARDPSFAGGNTLDTVFTARNLGAVRYPDGGMLIVGSGTPQNTYSNYSGVLLMKLTASGAYDPVFNSDAGLEGRRTLELEASPSSVLGRGTDVFFLSNSFLGKVDQRGSYSSGFGSGGKVSFTLASTLVDRGTGPLLVTVGLGNRSLWTVADDGTATSILSGTESTLPRYASSSPEGKLVGASQTAFVRTTTDLKNLDATFGMAGQYVPSSAEAGIAPIYIGKQLYTYGVVDGTFTVSRRLDNGAVDTAFANGGAKIAPYSGVGIMTLIGQADGRLIFAATTDHSRIYRIWP